MNVIKTIGKEESPIWIDMLFKEGPHKVENSPVFPPCFPISGNLKHDVSSSFFYLIYNKRVVGYSEIDKIIDTLPPDVGSERKKIKSKYSIVLKSELKKMPFSLCCRGFQGARYVDGNLHDMSKEAAVSLLKECNFKDVC